MPPARRPPAKRSSKLPAPQRSGRDERLVARIPSEEKSLLQRAAERSGQSLSAYVIAKARVAAIADLEEAGEVVLAARDQQLFVRLLLDPPKANARLLAALASADARFQSGIVSAPGRSSSMVAARSRTTRSGGFLLRKRDARPLSERTGEPGYQEEGGHRFPWPGVLIPWRLSGTTA